MTKSYNPNIASRDLKYYIFDWDDNILHMPTYIHLERRLGNGHWVPHLVSTAVFSVIRNDQKNYRPPDNDWEKAFVPVTMLAKAPNVLVPFQLRQGATGGRQAPRSLDRAVA